MIHPVAHRWSFIICAAMLLTQNSCVEKGCTDPNAINYKSSAQRDDESCYYGDKDADFKVSILENHARIAHALYIDAHAGAVNLANKAAAFAKKPTDDGFSETKLAWKQAYFDYLKCDALRFSDGPIDTRGHDRLLGVWPINPKLIDYVGSTAKGIVNDPSLITEISSSSIEAKNEVLGKGEVTTGFHVAEFLLWGADSADINVLTQGNRQYSDYDKDDSTVSDAERRSAYLTSCTELIVEHLSELVAEWDSTNVSAYRTDFLALENDDALKQVITGIATLTRAEMAERALENPLTSQSQMDEISTFSDNSTSDLIAMKRSYEILYTGDYKTESAVHIVGPSIRDLIIKLNPELGKSIDEQLDICSDEITSIPSPFDFQLGQEAGSNQGPINDAITALKALEDLWFEAAREIGFGLNTDLPE